ncbi:DNA polymerase epsilon catalytic subunit [Cryptosporidium felis]|nr:DNA polymerase epsilon catalytic subunit [Cryptosporidium felis]
MGKHGDFKNGRGKLGRRIEGSSRRLGSGRPSAVDRKFGICTQKLGAANREVGYLYNVQVSSEYISESGSTQEEGELGNPKSGGGIESFKERSCLYLYFINKQGVTFKSPFFFRPYFYLEARKGADIHWMLTNLEHKYRESSVEFSSILKEDLTLENHLIGEKRELIKASFNNVRDLVTIRNEILDSMKKFGEMTKGEAGFMPEPQNTGIDVLGFVSEMYEYDVQYETRVLIDNCISIGMWYESLRWTHELLELKCLEEDTSAPDLRCLAWDIETTKDPLKFPNVEKDQIMMISCMFEGQGYLITNREIVSQDIHDFEYSPKKEFDSFFKCINCANEKDLILRFVNLIQTLRPHIIASYNGDNFDFPFLYERAAKHDIDVTSEWGIRMELDRSSGAGGPQQSKKTIFSGVNIIHFDCFRWVERDSYLPCGSRGLKSVTKAKLRYNPVELDPELMVPYARSNPQGLAEYSVSDAVATYFLYKTYVHRFIFALATIIPLSGEDLLRKGSGTLCEHLLMKEAFSKNILFPNKKIQEGMEFFQNRPILNSTYVGGTVESLCSGIFRADIPEFFNLDSAVLEKLIENLDSTLRFGVKDSGIDIENIENFGQVKRDVATKLEKFFLSPKLKALPLIYHLDVGAMYPNIILTNRLQPTAVIEETVCMKCPFYSEASTCQRKMNWRWKGDVFPISRREMERMVDHLQIETFERTKGEDFGGDKGPKEENDDQSCSENDESPENADALRVGSTFGNKEKVKWSSLTARQQSEVLIQRMKAYCNKIYRKQTENIEETRSSIVCQRENPFYIDTVRRFRDRRYVYKEKKREAEEKLKKAESENDLLGVQDAQNEELLYESLQLAHKCILNSFYGYVMRKGSRWFSMEMAAIVTWLGGSVIKEARSLMESIGRPLELDTDGIWAILPEGFPEELVFHLKDGRKKKINYICTLLNQQVHKSWTNHQYLEFDSVSKKYKAKVENSIYFEVDGPYKCFFIPASDKQNKLLKKRYAVFGFDNKLRELKGFELKRRGELQLIKILQEELFPAFLQGSTKTEAYASVASVSRKWLNLIESKGRGILNDEELFFLISESKNMSKSVQQMGNAKSMSITTARRLFEFLQNPSYIQDKNVVCKFVVSELPKGEDKSQRAIPLSIFSTPLETRISWLSKWLRTSKMGSPGETEGSSVDSLQEMSIAARWNVRNILDWDYYKKRLTNTILKIVIIPAINQGVQNPLPELEVPSWVRHHAELVGTNQQKISEYFSVTKKREEPNGPRHREEGNETITSPKIVLETEKSSKAPAPVKEAETFSLKAAVIPKTDSGARLGKNERIQLFKEKGFKAWLEYHKKFWLEGFESYREKKAEVERLVGKMDKTRLAEIGKGSIRKGLEAVSEFQFLSKGRLHILDIYPMTSRGNSGEYGSKYAGLFNVVMYSELTGCCYTVVFEFLRRFYIASKVQIKVTNSEEDAYGGEESGNLKSNDDFQARAVSTGKELPRGVPYNHLTEISISEGKFWESRETLVCDNNTVGIYETNIPLEFSILERFGNIIESSTPSVEKLLLRNGAVSDRFWSPTGAGNKSLTYGDSIHWLFLSICNFEDRICFSLSDLNSRKICFFLASGQTVQNSTIRAELLKQLKGNSRLRSLEVAEASYFKTAKEAAEGLDQILDETTLEFQNEPLVMLVQSTVEKDELVSRVGETKFSTSVLREADGGSTGSPLDLESSFGVRREKILVLWEGQKEGEDDGDSKSEIGKFSRFDWCRDSVRHSLACLKKLINKLQLTLELAKVSRLPVLYLFQFKGNLTYLLYDILYSREIHSMGLLSWGTLKSVPDLGNPRLLRLSKSDWDLRLLGGDYMGGKSGTGNGETDVLEVVVPGVYRSYGVQLDFKQWLLIESVRNCKILAEKYNLNDFEENERRILGGESRKKRKTDSGGGEEVLVYNLGNKKRLRNLSEGQEISVLQPLYSHSSACTSSAFLCLQKTINQMRFFIENHWKVNSIFRTYRKCETGDGETPESGPKTRGKQSVMEWEDKEDKNGGELEEQKGEQEEEQEEDENLLFEFMVALQEKFYSWLSSPVSLLHDPALVDKAKEYASRYFRSLEAEMENMGIQVVYGNIRKMILVFRVEELSLGKVKGFGDLRDHFAKLMQVLNNKEIYSGISLSPCVEYKAMIQIDRSNYIRRTLGGPGSGLEDPYEMSLSLLSFFPVNSRRFIVDEISRFLMDPLRGLRSFSKKSSGLSLKDSIKILRNLVLDLYGPFGERFQAFMDAISNPSGYILSKYGIEQFEDPLEKLRYDGDNYREEPDGGEGHAGGARRGGIPAVGEALDNLEAEDSWRGASENKNLNSASDQSFVIFPKSIRKNSARINLEKQRRAETRDLFEFPPYIGETECFQENRSKPSLKLELVKLFVHIWKLDKAFHLDEDGQKQLERMICMLCQMCDISEFDPIVTEGWETPLLTFLIKDFVCPNCFEIEDFDFTGNAIQDEDEDEEEEDTEREIEIETDFARKSPFGTGLTWYCGHCNYVVDRRLLEERILAEYFERLEAIQSQDVLCSVCKSVQVGKMQKQCHNCTGTLTTRLENHKGFRKFFKFFGSVARYYSHFNATNRKNHFRALVEFKEMYENVFSIEH